MTARNPIEFTKRTEDGHHQRCGNEVALDDSVVTAIADAIATALATTDLQVEGEKQYIVNDLAAEYTLTVGAVAVPLTALHVDTARVYFRIENEDVRFTLHPATLPTAGVSGVGFGSPLFPDDILWLNVSEATNIRLISNGAGTAYAHVLEYKDV